MRHVLVLSTVVIGTAFGGWANQKSSQANPVPASELTSDVSKVAETAAMVDPATDSGGIAAQVAGLTKGDRLFTIRQAETINGADAASGITGDDDAEAEPAGDVPPQLTTGEFCEALAEAAEASNIPVAFFARLIWQESKFKHDATSQVGAQGVAQFMPGTAAEMGLDDPFDPRKALPASARFLRKLHDQFGNLGLAAAAYNAGSGRIQNWLARRGPLPDETRNYVRKITGNAAETWTSERKTAALQQELPREAPCEGIGGLSRTKEVAAIPVALTPAISGIIHKAEAEAARAAAAAKAKARLLLAKASKRKDATRLASAEKAGESDKGPARQTVVIRVASAKASATKLASLGHRKSKDGKSDARRIKVASAAK